MHRVGIDYSVLRVQNIHFLAISEGRVVERSAVPLFQCTKFGIYHATDWYPRANEDSKSKLVNTVFFARSSLYILFTSFFPFIAFELALRILWSLAFSYQILMTQHIYAAWMFSKNRNFTGDIFWLHIR